MTQTAKIIDASFTSGVHEFYRDSGMIAIKASESYRRINHTNIPKLTFLKFSADKSLSDVFKSTQKVLLITFFG